MAALIVIIICAIVAVRKKPEEIKLTNKELDDFKTNELLTLTQISNEYKYAK